MKYSWLGIAPGRSYSLANRVNKSCVILAFILRVHSFDCLYVKIIFRLQQFGAVYGKFSQILSKYCETHEGAMVHNKNQIVGYETNPRDGREASRSSELGPAGVNGQDLGEIFKTPEEIKNAWVYLRKRNLNFDEEDGQLPATKAGRANAATKGKAQLGGQLALSQGMAASKIHHLQKDGGNKICNREELPEESQGNSVFNHLGRT